jgi:hypothetical protein
MDCPCCKAKLTRAGDLPEIRGWMRYETVKQEPS